MLGEEPLGQSESNTHTGRNGLEEIRVILQPLSPAAYCLHHLLDFCILTAW